MWTVIILVLVLVNFCSQLLYIQGSILHTWLCCHQTGVSIRKILHSLYVRLSNIKVTLVTAHFLLALNSFSSKYFILQTKAAAVVGENRIDTHTEKNVQA